MTTAYEPRVVILAIDERSLARSEVGSDRSRSSVVTTAAASNGVPSLKRSPRRSGIVYLSLSLEIRGSRDASTGTTSERASKSYNRSHMLLRTSTDEKPARSVG